MPRFSRRSALGILAAGTFSAVAVDSIATAMKDAHGRSGKLSRRLSPITAENQLPGSRSWRRGADGTRVADDIQMQIKGYASATSVNVGESIDFHVTVNPAADFTVTIYRLGYYGSDGARHLVTSPALRGVRQAAPALETATGLISCRWSSAWTLDVPPNWTSGLYLAVFTAASGWRSFTPFVVRDDQRNGGLCVILPFSTYQAYNQWPLDGKLGKSLYHGYDLGGPAGEIKAPVAAQHGRHLAYSERAFKVSFDRPYARDGLPNRIDYDHDFIRWAEQAGYDVTYATSIDLHTGRIDPSRYAGLIFCGHDEYWSRAMRDVATRAVAQGASLAFMAANNVYWHVRFEPSSDGRDSRVVVCYKSDADPAPDASGATMQWRNIRLGPADPEQGLLGIQYNGIISTPVPLVVQASDHWFWAGCGVKNGDLIDKIVGGEADGLDPRHPGPAGITQTLLSASPYQLRNGSQLIQNTSVYETAQGAVVFVAATLYWPLGLSRPRYQDARIQAATANLLDRMLRQRRI